MATFSKVVPSGSTSGKGIKIAATGTAGTTFHTATSGAVNIDEVWLYLYNGDTVARVVTVEFGGVTVPDNNVILTIQPKAGLVCAIPGMILNGGLTVAAFADAANVVTMTGFINRITA